jgi:hypothetical protein
MKKVLISIVMLMAIAAFASAEEICTGNHECDDNNECTIDSCTTTITFTDPSTALIEYGSCQSVPVYDGMPCDIDGKLGKCVSGECLRNNAKANVKKTAPVQIDQEIPEDVVPEFSTLAAGLAFAGASIGYLVIRKIK